MLTTNSTSAAMTLTLANVISPAKWEKITNDEYGYVFTCDHFAKDWESIYVRTDNLERSNVSKGMRKLTSPSLILTSKEAMMAMVIASEKNPVYLISEDVNDIQFGRLMAFNPSTHILPEYVFLLCQNLKEMQVLSRDKKSHDINSKNYIPDVCRTDTYDSEIDKYFEECSNFIKRIFGGFEIPSIPIQWAHIDDFKKFANYKRLDVSNLVSSYMFWDIFNKDVIKTRGISLLLECYLRAAGDRANKKIKDILSDNVFESGILSEKELEFLSNNLKELFNQIISYAGVKIYPSPGFLQPQEVTDFMCQIACFPEHVVVYNPFSGANSYAITLPNQIVGEELNPIAWALGQIRMFANCADQHAEIALADSFESMKTNKKFSAIIASPAYMHDEEKEISDIVKALYNKLDEGGTLACLVPTEFLFRKDDKTHAIRDRLINEKAISKVVMLPSNIFAGISVDQAAIVLTKGIENTEIHFGDASGHTRFAKSVYRATTFDLESFMDAFSEDIIDTQEGNEPCDDQAGVATSYIDLIGSELTPSLYLAPKPKNGIPLSYLVEEITELSDENISTEYFITGSSIPSAMHRKPFVPAKIKEREAAIPKKHAIVPEKAVILAIAGGNIRTVYTEDFTGKVAFSAEFIKILKPIEGISPKYLAAVLSTKIVADQIKAQTVGLTIPRLNKLNLSQILVPVHDTVEEREKLIAEVLSSEMNDLESELQETLDSQKREVRSTRHALIQTLSALSSNWEQLKMFTELRKEGIKLSDTVGRINPISVCDLMGSIGYAISTLQRQVESLRFEKPDWGKDVEINPYKFLNDYIATHSSPSVRMVNIGNDNVADFPYFEDETGDTKYHHTDNAEIFYAPVRLLERIFNNIVANAKAHGFSSDSNNNEIRFDWKTENGRIVITIANNGCPLKEGVSGDDVLMSGFTTALNENASDGTLHSGQGGFEIKSLMEGLGTVEVISQPGVEFPVIYKLTFEKTNFETIKF